jgi:hypothetical protein
MDVTMLIPLVASWLEHTFPSLAEYTKYVGPAFMILLSAVGVFTDLLPEPNHKYPVPDVTELEAELQGSAGFILKLAKFTRSLTVSVNWFIGTAVYGWFYNFTNKISNFLPRFGRKTPPQSK